MRNFEKFNVSRQMKTDGLGYFPISGEFYFQKYLDSLQIASCSNFFIPTFSATLSSPIFCYRLPISWCLLPISVISLSISWSFSIRPPLPNLCIWLSHLWLVPAHDQICPTFGVICGIVALYIRKRRQKAVVHDLGGFFFTATYNQNPSSTYNGWHFYF